MYGIIMHRSDMLTPVLVQNIMLKINVMSCNMHTVISIKFVKSVILHTLL
jgi:hypothetical protein